MVKSLWTNAETMAHKKNAKKLLSEGINVTNYALENGYGNASHFIKAYKLVYEGTPTAIREESF
jgi:AraC-like DNA-binding protein